MMQNIFTNIKCSEIILYNANENWYIILYDLFSRLCYIATCGPFCVDPFYSECSPLIQLIALINNLKADKNDTILVMIESKSHSFCRFAFSVSRSYLNSYNPECKILDCFVCKSE